MANGDVKIQDGGLVHVEGDVLKVDSYDLQLDNASRRSNKNQDKPRRALVHDKGDGLTINWARDYPGGVTINGSVRCPDDVSASKIVVKGPPTLSGQKSIGSGDVHIHVGVTLPRGGGMEVTEVIVGAAIVELRAQVAALQQEIAALKAKIG
jgi:hypothetical protein